MVINHVNYKYLCQISQKVDVTLKISVAVSKKQKINFMQTYTCNGILSKTCNLICVSRFISCMIFRKKDELLIPCMNLSL